MTLRANEVCANRQSGNLLLVGDRGNAVPTLMLLRGIEGEIIAGLRKEIGDEGAKLLRVAP